MGTPCKAVYEAFLAGIEQDEWDLENDIEMLEADWFQLLRKAIQRFMFPRVELAVDAENQTFTTEIGEAEIALLAVIMKNEWYKRCLSSWKVMEQQYHTKDFNFLSQANHMSKLQDLVELSNKEVLNQTNVYGRMVNQKPFKWSGLAGERS